MTRRRYPISDHYDGTRFLNPHAVAGTGPGRSHQMAAHAEVGAVARARRHSCRTSRHHAVRSARPRGGDLHRALHVLLRTAGTVLITDPVFTSHAGPFGRLGPRRVRPPAIPHRSACRRPSIVLVSHNHYDHLQPSSLRALRERSDPLFVAPLGVESLLRGHRVVEGHRARLVGDARRPAPPRSRRCPRSTSPRGRPSIATARCGAASSSAAAA